MSVLQDKNPYASPIRRKQPLKIRSQLFSLFPLAVAIAWAAICTLSLPAQQALDTPQQVETEEQPSAGEQLTTEELLANTTEELLANEERAFQQAVQRAAPSVVQIETFGSPRQSGSELVSDGPTTGTIISEDGWIISSLFSFRDQPASVLVSLPDGQRAAAQVVSRDYSRELVWLKVDAKGLPTAQIADPKSIAVGHWAIALGKTYDRSTVSQSVGIVSALGRAYGKAVQSDAKISPINYGGPLIDLSGRVIGILSPISPGSFLEGDSTELYDSGIGFAIPLGDVLSRKSTAQAGEDIHSGLLGVVADDQNELAGPVKISGASPGSPAARAGVRAGDIVVSAFGQPIKLLANLRHALGPVDAGSNFEFSVDRQGETIQFECLLAKEIPVYQRRYLGLRIRTVASKGGSSSLEITAIEKASPASNSPLRPGMRIVKIDHIDNPSEDQLLSAIAVAELDTPLNITVRTDEGDERIIPLLAGTWPQSLPEELPIRTGPDDDNLEAEVTEISLGDFPNKTFVITPPTHSDPAADTAPASQGLLVLFPEPGELEQEKTLNHWNAFCRDHGWIVVVINSGNPRAWAREEVELGSRVLLKMENTYDIDSKRIVIGGLGVGGRISLMVAAAHAERVSGVLALGTDLGRFALRQRNAPKRSLDFLLVGNQERLAPQVTALQKSGYAAIAIDAPMLEPAKWETVPAESIRLWLEGLGRL